MRDVIELIKIRRSVRSYTGQKINPDTKNKIIQILDEKRENLFDSQLRFEFIDATDLEPNLTKNLGTYGMITGAKYFIAGITREEDGRNGIIDFGYAFEKNILYLTSLGLGTCWLGGTFNKKGFSDKVGLKYGEILPGVSPVGYGIKKIRFKDSAVRKFAGSDKRKSWEKLFFKKDFLTPLTEKEVGEYRVPLEMVRLGPSAINKQPWRVIKEDGDIFHFFVEKSRAYSNKPDHLNLQYIDIGICLCHFGLSVSQLGLKGNWQIIKTTEKNKNYKIPANAEYIISWVK